MALKGLSMVCSPDSASLRVSAPPRLCVKTSGEQPIPEMVADLSREEMRRMVTDGKLTPYGKRMAKFLDRALPPEKVDEWGFLPASRQGVCYEH